MRRDARKKRHIRIRKYLVGSSKLPRLSVFRSNQHIYAQIIDDTVGRTLVFAGDYQEQGSKLQKAYNVGKNLAKIAAKFKIKNVVFDRGGYLYQGRIAQLAKGAREEGLKF